MKLFFFKNEVLKHKSIYVVLLFSVLIGMFLRFYNLREGMTFIGDQGWFYLSARDFLLDGKFPLVGIASSHTWLHQGPLWTYLLAIQLLIFNFNPLGGALLTSFLGVVTIFVIYYVGKELFSRFSGLVAALIYSSSLLIVISDRMSFDTAPIPLFTTLYILSIYRWVKGNLNYFPISIFLLILLYNLELATFSLFYPFVLIFLIGMYKKKNYVKVFNKRIIGLTFIAFVPMIPVFIYDLSNGFKQTVVFFLWTIYKPITIFLGKGGSILQSFNGIFLFIFDSVKKIIFDKNIWIANIIFIPSVIYVSKIFLKKPILEKPIFPFFLLFAFSAFGIFINQTPSGAYLPVIFPFFLLTVGIFFEKLAAENKVLQYFSFFLLSLITLFNFHSSYQFSSTDYFLERERIVDKAISLVGKNKYNLVGRGVGSNFESFTMNYEYLLWWKGYPPSKSKEKIKIIVTEENGGIRVKKE